MCPYWTSSDGRLVIYHGDCRDVLPTLDPVDLVLTDPPYGIATVWQGGFGKGWKQSAKTEAVRRNEWDLKPPDAALIRVLLGMGKDAVIWGGNYFDLPVSRGWLVWSKPERGFSLADAELAWTTRDMVIRVADLRSNRAYIRLKPVALMKWCLRFFQLRRSSIPSWVAAAPPAALGLNRRAIGIEIEERYCEIAAKRPNPPFAAMRRRRPVRGGVSVRTVILAAILAVLLRVAGRRVWSWWGYDGYTLPPELVRKSQ
jgi:DNA modification methylase